MKQQWPLYIPLVCLLLFYGCSSSQFPMTKEFKDNNISAEVHFSRVVPEKIYFLDYRVYKYKLLGSHMDENISRLGIILPSQSSRIKTTESELLFARGNDSCIIHFEHSEVSNYTGRSATTSVINLFSKKSNKIPQHTTNELLEDHSWGTIIYPGSENGCSFNFTNIKLKEQATGKLVIGKDVFLLNPIMGGNKNADGKGTRFMGLQLVKGDSMYAALRLPLLGNIKVFIYSGATPTEQLLFAACFAAIVPKL